MTYNGYGMHEFVPQRTAAYISQHDLHMPELTVRETLAFSARCQGVGARHGWLNKLLFSFCFTVHLDFQVTQFIVFDNLQSG